MERKRFIKFIISLPFGPFLAQKMKQGEKQYLLNKFYVAGFQYYSGPSFIHEMQPGEKLDLTADPDNPFDRFAVKITRKGTMMGHVPRTDNKHISRLLRQEMNLRCVVAKVNPERETWKMLKVELYL